jgi:hypothetical protein
MTVRLVWVLDGPRGANGDSDISYRLVSWYVDSPTVEEARRRHGNAFWWSELHQVPHVVRRVRHSAAATIDKDGAN